MSVDELEAAMNAPEAGETCRRLSDLTFGPRHLPSGKSLFDMADKVLANFFDRSLPFLKRRWSGMVLTRLMEASPTVFEHLRTISLSQLGSVILDGEETENLRIVAGFIIRELLRGGIPYTSVWPSPLVPNNLPNFPTEEGSRWMTDFQGFVDNLFDLHISKVAELVTEPAILYFVSFSTSNGVKFVALDSGQLLMIVEREYVSIISTSTPVRTPLFIDIPLHHIETIRKQKPTLHDSQGREMTHEPWELVLEMKTGPWTYLANAQERESEHLTIMFPNTNDAEEAMAVIKEAVQTLLQQSQNQSRYRMSSSQMLDVSRSDPAVESPKLDDPSPTEAEEPVSESSPVVTLPDTEKPANQSLPLAKKAAPATNAVRNNDSANDGLKDVFAVPESPVLQTKSAPIPTKVPQNVLRLGNLRIQNQTRRLVVESERVNLAPNDKANQKEPPTKDPSGVGNDENRRSVTAQDKPIGITPDSRPSRTSRQSSQFLNQTEKKSVAAPSIKKLSRVVKKTRISKEKDDIFEIPSDNFEESPKRIRRRKRPSFDLPISDDKVHSEDDGSESEYGRKRPSKKARVMPAKKKTARQNEVKHKPAASKPTPTAKSNTKKGRAQNSKSVPPSRSQGVSSIRGESQTSKHVAIKGAAPTPPVQIVSKRSTGDGKIQKQPTQEQSLSPQVPIPQEPILLNPNPHEPTLPTPKDIEQVLSNPKPREPLLSEPKPGDPVPSRPELQNPRVPKLMPREPAVSKFKSQESVFSNLKHQDKILSKTTLKQTSPHSTVAMALGPGPEFIPHAGQTSQSLNAVKEHSIEKASEVVHVINDDSTTKRQPGSVADGPQLVNVPEPLLEALVHKPILGNLLVEADMADPPPPAPRLSRKRHSSIHRVPSTPESKRTRIDDLPSQALNCHDQNDPREPNRAKGHHLLSTTRVMNDPESPCPAGEHRVRQVSFNNPEHTPAVPAMGSLIYSMYSDQKEKEIGSGKVAKGTSPCPRSSGRRVYSRRKSPPRRRLQRRTSIDLHKSPSHILSSNAKPRPASPNAESRAISGHASSDRVEMDVEMANHQTARMDPFKDNAGQQKSHSTAFTRRLTEEAWEAPQETPTPAYRSVYRKGTNRIQPGVCPTNGIKKEYREAQLPARSPTQLRQIETYARSNTHMKREPAPKKIQHMDGSSETDEEKTLVAPEQHEIDGTKHAPIYLPSSPPGPPSSHSSTSAESSSDDEPALPSEVSEETEWEAALEPHQRAIGDALTHISKRLLRHIVDKETAVNDVAELYARDGTEVIQRLVVRRTGSLESILPGIQARKDNMKKELSTMAQKLQKEREAIVVQEND